MSAPICESQEMEIILIKFILYDITNGMNQAQNIGDTDLSSPLRGLSPMTSIGIVDNSDRYIPVGWKQNRKIHDQRHGAIRISRPYICIQFIL